MKPTGSLSPPGLRRGLQAPRVAAPSGQRDSALRPRPRTRRRPLTSRTPPPQPHGQDRHSPRRRQRGHSLLALPAPSRSATARGWGGCTKPQGSWQGFNIFQGRRPGGPGKRRSRGQGDAGEGEERPRRAPGRCPGGGGAARSIREAHPPRPPGPAPRPTRAAPRIADAPGGGGCGKAAAGGLAARS